MCSETTKSALVDLNVHNMDKRTEKVSSHMFFLFIQHIFLLTFIILLLDYYVRFYLFSSFSFWKKCYGLIII